jgi:signal transduction histidine kinase
MAEIEFAELISKIAHELRSPLTSVKGFSATLVKRWDRFTDEQKLQFVETILADAERMSRIVSEVLDLARIETGRLELNQTDAHLHSIAERALEQVAQLDGAKRVSLGIDDDLTAWADPERLQRVLANLIENAIKFSDDGPITVDAIRDGAFAQVKVVDAGVGIPADRIETIFLGPAPRAGHAMPLGSGLGLYISRKLVEAHGGSIGVESKEGAGSTFTVRLPAEAAA